MSYQYFVALGLKKSTNTAGPGQTFPSKLLPSASLMYTFLFNPYRYAVPLTFIPASIIGIYLYFYIILFILSSGNRY